MKDLILHLIMSWRRLWLCAVLLAFAAPVAAQDAAALFMDAGCFGDACDAPPPEMMPVPPPPAASPVPMDPSLIAVSVPATPAVPLQEAVEVVKDAQQVVDDWGRIGWFAGLLALVNMLIKLSRKSFVEAFLEARDLKWVKPVVALVLGGVLGGMTSWTRGNSVLYCIVEGVFAGAGAVAAHEVANPRKKTAEQNTVEAAMTLKAPV